MASLLAQRQLAPELLDHLPVADPQAIGSRRDLRWINAIMLQASLMAWRLRRDLATPPRRVLELGCGDGAFMLAVARRMARHWPDVHLVLLDQQDLVPAARRQQFADLGWRVETVTAEAIDWMEQTGADRFDLVTANLFLHHFGEPELARLLTAIARLSPILVATEPRRSRLALWATGWLRLIGANRVTLHDAAASVRAGFTGRELGTLWPGETAREYAAGPFTHVFSARSAP